MHSWFDLEMGGFTHEQESVIAEIFLWWSLLMTKLLQSEHRLSACANCVCMATCKRPLVLATQAP